MTRTRLFTWMSGTAAILALLLAVGCATPNAAGRVSRAEAQGVAPGTSGCAAFACEP